jgi:hypothetical protein
MSFSIRWGPFTVRRASSPNLMEWGVKFKIWTQTGILTIDLLKLVFELMWTAPLTFLVTVFMKINHLLHMSDFGYVACFCHIFAYLLLNRSYIKIWNFSWRAGITKTGYFNVLFEFREGLRLKRWITVQFFLLQPFWLNIWNLIWNHPQVVWLPVIWKKSHVIANKELLAKTNIPYICWFYGVTLQSDVPNWTKMSQHVAGVLHIRKVQL